MEDYKSDLKRAKRDSEEPEETDSSFYREFDLEKIAEASIDPDIVIRI